MTEIVLIQHKLEVHCIGSPHLVHGVGTAVYRGEKHFCEERKTIAQVRDIPLIAN